MARKKKRVVKKMTIYVILTLNDNILSHCSWYRDVAREYAKEHNGRVVKFVEA